VPEEWKEDKRISNSKYKIKIWCQKYNKEDKLKLQDNQHFQEILLIFLIHQILQCFVLNVVLNLKIVINFVVDAVRNVCKYEKY